MKNQSLEKHVLYFLRLEEEISSCIRLLGHKKEEAEPM